MSVTRAGVVAAATNVGLHVRHTPCMTVEAPLPGTAATVPVVLKLESLQVTGSFKPRGAAIGRLADGFQNRIDAVASP